MVGWEATGTGFVDVEDGGVTTVYVHPSGRTRPRPWRAPGGDRSGITRLLGIDYCDRRKNELGRQCARSNFRPVHGVCRRLRGSATAYSFVSFMLSVGCSFCRIFNASYFIGSSPLAQRSFSVVHAVRF